jgi:hypothetical protein
MSFPKSGAEARRDHTGGEEMSEKCNNPRHPRGRWHTSTPIPGSWQFLARFRFWLNRKRWGCGCND